jgi:hypothetical protein
MTYEMVVYMTADVFGSSNRLNTFVQKKIVIIFIFFVLSHFLTSLKAEFCIWLH